MWSWGTWSVPLLVSVGIHEGAASISEQLVWPLRGLSFPHAGLKDIWIPDWLHQKLNNSHFFLNSPVRGGSEHAQLLPWFREKCDFSLKNINFSNILYYPIKLQFMWGLNTFVLPKQIPEFPILSA